MHVDESANISKSYLIDMISIYLFDMMKQHKQLNSVLQAAFTKVMMFSI